MGSHMPMMMTGSLPQMGGMNGMGPMHMGANQFGQMGHVGQFGQMPLQMTMTGTPNPFRASTMLPQQTGFMGPQATGFGHQPFQQLHAQQTGFLQPQATGQMAFGTPQRSMTMPVQPTQPMGQQQPFGLQQPQHSGQQQQHPFGLQAQPTGFLQPQTTGSNPFRASTLGPLSTNMGAFSQPASPFHHSPLDSRPGSAPGGTPSKITAQKTGSNNPFAPPGGVPAPAPAVPKQPTMNDLAQQKWQQQFAAAGGLNPQPQQPQTHQQHQQAPVSTSTFSFDPLDDSNKGGSGSAMSDIASAFAMDKPQAQPQGNDLMSQFGGLSINTGATSPSAPSPSPGGFLQPQRTGYGGSTVKPFKPTSNFGSSLMETLPPIPEPQGQTPTQSFPFNAPPSNGGTPGVPGAGGHTPVQGQSTGANLFPVQSQSTGANLFSSMAPQKTGFQPTSNFGQQLAANPTGMPQRGHMQPQNTGSNPFRASMLPSPTGGHQFDAFGASPFAQNHQNQTQTFPQRQNSLF